MEGQVRFLKEKSADGKYIISAPGYAAVTLYWANEQGALEEWLPFACVPVSSDGNAHFIFLGDRAVPQEAARILVRAVDERSSREEVLFLDIPCEQKHFPIKKGITFCAMSDLHLSSKAWVLHQALLKAQDAHILLLAGDMTNDGSEAQFSRLKEQIDAVLPQMPVFAVRGNHDIPRETADGTEKSDTVNYMEFQKWLENRMSLTGGYEYGPDGAYAVCIQDVELIGLQAVTDKRQFLFRNKEQLDWLEAHLSKEKDRKWHLILCHAPLLHHNPKRVAGKHNPYLHCDKELQSILDRHGNVVFISGHTHLSMDDVYGCVEWDRAHHNLYINDASIRPTDLLPRETIQLPEWREGTCLYITVSDEEIEIVTHSIKSSKKHARGYYRISKR